MTQPTPLKPGDLVSIKGVPATSPAFRRMVVEQTFNRGKAQYVICSYVDDAWAPATFAASILARLP